MNAGRVGDRIATASARIVGGRALSVVSMLRGFGLRLQP